MKKFEWVDHPSDIGFRSYGADLSEVFENSALALTEIMTDSEDIEAKGEISIQLQSEDREALLFDWLDSLLYLFDAEDMIASEFEVEEISEKEDQLVLNAKIWGENYDHDRHSMGTEVKAVTYHMMEIECGENGCSAQVIVDI